MRGGEHGGRNHTAEIALAFIGLLWLTHGLDFVLYEIFPKIVVRAFALALFAASVTFLVLNRNGEKWARTWPVWIGPMLALLSIAWSDHPGLTLRRSTALLGCTCFGVFLGLRLDLEERIRLVAACIAVIAVLSVLLVISSPELGLMPAANKEMVWRGVFGHKNYLGRAMTLGALAFLLLAFRSARFSWFAIGVAVCALLTFASTSASAIISLAVTLAAATVLRIIQRLPAKDRFRSVAFAILIGLAVTGLAVSLADDVLAPLGRDATLTGRVHIWQASWKAIRLQPWLGYGFGAVWYTDLPGIHRLITHHTGFDPFTAHSGFFDLLLELGFVGLVAVAIPIAFCAARGIVQVVRDDAPLALWSASYVVFFIVANIAESELLRQNSIFWVLLVASVVKAGDDPAP